MAWRQYIIPYLKPNSLTDVYEFGVCTGASMCDIHRAFTTANRPYRKFFGLDSFEGLPEETAEPIYQDCWRKGCFDARKHFSVDSVDKCVSKVYNILEEGGLTNPVLIPGFYEDVLTDDIVEQYDMGPAIYIDIDVDIYSSAITVLDFMFRNKLIRRGTLIGYDDWGGTPDWRTFGNGESRAHAEACQKYGAECQHIAQMGNSSPHVHIIWKVINI